MWTQFLITVPSFSFSFPSIPLVFPFAFSVLLHARTISHDCSIFLLFFSFNSSSLSLCLFCSSSCLVILLFCSLSIILVTTSFSHLSSFYVFKYFIPYISPVFCALPYYSIITLVISFMYDIYNYIPETNRVSTVFSVTAVLYLQSVLHVMLFRVLNMFCTFTSALPTVCVQCTIWLFFAVP